jgi:hypothetical protein
MILDRGDTTDGRRKLPGFSQIGKNLEEVKVLSLLAICVIERAATHCADNLAARSELDNGERATAFEAFIAALKKEAI